MINRAVKSITGTILSPFPGFTFTDRRVINSLVTRTTTQAMASNIGLQQFSVGGRVACEASIGKFASSTTQLVPGGGFNSSGDVSTWTNTSAGSSAALSWSYATDQFVAGSGSAKMTFTQSDNNNYPEISYTWSTPQDLTVWRYIVASVRVTVAAGGNQTRTVSVRLRSGTAIAIWQITGTTTTAPFNTEQWQLIEGDLNVPQSTAGTGTFDLNSVDQISLRLLDGGNKSGSIWWDDVKLSGAITPILKIYSAAGSTVSEQLNPVATLTSTDTLIIQTRNNGATAGEIQTYVSGVSI